MKAKSHRGFQRCFPETGSRSYYVVFIWLTTRPHLRETVTFTIRPPGSNLFWNMLTCFFKRYLTLKHELSIDESLNGTKALKRYDTIYSQ